jgi:hypothetical protein
MESSLEPVGWGLVYSDLVGRVFLPFNPQMDRGLALERSLGHYAHLASHWDQHDGSAPSDAWLASDLLQPKPGEFPVLLINSTSATRGVPMVFSNTEFPASTTALPAESDAPHHAGILNFHVETADHDTALPSAVRMSATFPYVSPAARASCNCDTDYLVDGGYYDNYGMVSLLEWLKDSKEAMSQNPGGSPEIVILRIESFPEGLPAKAKTEGWSYQLLAPLLALFAARSSGQLYRDDAELRMFKQLQALEAGANDPKALSVHDMTFRYDPTNCECRGEDPPLSWHLTEPEKKCIRDAWMTPRLNACRAYIKDFLDASKPVGTPPPFCK